MLFKKHTGENYKVYLMSLIVLVGIVILTIGVMTHHMTNAMPINLQIPTFAFFFIASGTIFTSNIFVNLGDKKKAIATLTLPASSFEKFLVGWIYSYIFFQVIFTALFYTVIWSFLTLGHYPEGTVQIMNIFSYQQSIFIIYLFYALLHAVVIYGAVYFKKMHFIKTAFIFFVGLFVLWLINLQVLAAMIKEKISNNPPFSGVSFVNGHGYYNLDLPEENRKWIVLIFFMVSFIIWLATYFRLKEKQV